MRIERQYHRGAADRTRVVARLTDHALVAQMNTVEDTNGQANLLGVPPQFFKCTEDAHHTAVEPTSLRMGMMSVFNCSRVCCIIISSEWASFTSKLPDRVRRSSCRCAPQPSTSPISEQRVRT